MKTTLKLTIEGDLRDWIAHLADRHGRTEAEIIHLILDRAYRNHLSANAYAAQLRTEKAK